MVWSESQLATVDKELSVFIVGMVEEKSAENGGTSMSCANVLPRNNFHIHVYGISIGILFHLTFALKPPNS